MTENEQDLFLTHRNLAVSDFSDPELIAEMMREDYELGYGEPDYARYDELVAEIHRRFGPDATENTAEASVFFHMAHEDLIRWPLENWADCKSWLTGETTVDNYDVKPGAVVEVESPVCNGSARATVLSVDRSGGSFVATTNGHDYHRFTLADRSIMESVDI